ncbi:MAG: hypothetical protein HYV76_01745 [Candidatus Vogelbacteria bacterium]|nr:hypothetical protein [Candidatus Vogelbacteria bacterium]
MDDIVKPKKSLREILPKRPSSQITRVRPVPLEDTPLTSSSTPPVQTFNQTRLSRDVPKRGIIWGAGIIVVVLVIILLSGALARATITITPRQAAVPVTGSFEASQTPGAAPIEFGLMRTTDREQKIVTATGVEQRSDKAKGLITIYNNYDDKVQKLITNTRFETTDGKVYRITSAVNVPGQTTKDGVKTPGQITVPVLADKPGAEYNIGPSEFTIPGFKGDPRYTAFSGRSGGPMTGGFVGEMRTVSPTDKAKARAELQEAIRQRIVEKANGELPDTALLFADSVQMSFNEGVPITATSSSNNVILVEEANLTAIVFDNKKLARGLAVKLLPGYNREEIRLVNPEELKFSLINKITTSTVPDKITFNLEGTAKLVWDFDQASLIEKLRGVVPAEYPNIFALYPGIEKAGVSFFPPWSGDIPDNNARVKVILDLK